MDVPQDCFGGQRGPVADALNLNAGVALAAAQVSLSPGKVLFGTFSILKICMIRAILAMLLSLSSR